MYQSPHLALVGLKIMSSVAGPRSLEGQLT